MHKINNDMTKIKGISQDDLKGTKLEGFPEKVIKLMLKRQVEQGNKKDIEIFKKSLDAYKENGGFYWRDTEEGFNAWYDAIYKKRFDLLFKNRKPKIGKTVKKVFAIVALTFITLSIFFGIFVSFSGDFTILNFLRIFGCIVLFLVFLFVFVVFIDWCIEQLKN